MINQKQTLSVFLIFSVLLVTCIILNVDSVYAGWRRPDSDTDDQSTEPKDTDETQDKTEETDQQSDTESSDDTSKKLVQGGIIGGLSAVGAKVVNDKIATNQKRKCKDIKQPLYEPVMVAGPVTPESV